MVLGDRARVSIRDVPVAGGRERRPAPGHPIVGRQLCRAPEAVSNSLSVRR